MDNGDDNQRLDRLETTVRRDRLVRRIGTAARWLAKLGRWAKTKLATPALVVAGSAVAVSGVAAGIGLNAERKADDATTQVVASREDIAAARQATDEAAAAVESLATGLTASADDLTALLAGVDEVTASNLRAAVDVLTMADQSLATKLDDLENVDQQLEAQSNALDQRITVLPDQFQASIERLMVTVAEAQTTERQARETVDAMVMAALSDLTSSLATNSASDTATGESVAVLARTVADLTAQLSALQTELADARARLDGWDTAQTSLCNQARRASWNPIPPFC
jgi:chromosome segregation ATPase